MRAIQVTEFGGPEVLQLVDLPDPEPGDGFEVYDVAAAGINYADTHQAENSYLSKQTLPLVPGGEFVGSQPGGPRVVGLVGTGGYAEKVRAHPSTVWPVPAGVDDATALALVVQGTTAWHMLRTSAHLAEGQSVVVHAAAGGVGSLAVQLAKLWGAGRVIATASSEKKRDLALSLGADVAIDPNVEDLTAALKEANGGSRVDIVLEMTGGPVFDASLVALAPFGRLVTYGMASRQNPKPIHAGSLLAHSTGVIGFWLVHCLQRPGMLGDALSDLFSLVQDGKLKAFLGGTYSFDEVRRAHEDLRSRRTMGKLVLDPSR